MLYNRIQIMAHFLITNNNNNLELMCCSVDIYRIAKIPDPSLRMIGLWMWLGSSYQGNKDPYLNHV